MECKRVRQYQESSGAWSPVTAFAYRWHLGHCPACRTAVRQENEIKAQLRQFATEPVSDELRQRIVQSAPASRRNRERYRGLLTGSGKLEDNKLEDKKIGDNKMKMRRLRAVALCTALFVMVTGAFAAKFLFQPYFECSDQNLRK